MRTQEELVKRAGEVLSHPIFGDDCLQDIMMFVEREPAMKVEGLSVEVVSEITDEQWRESEMGQDLTVEAVVDQMSGYIGFAREKCEGQRGISATRSVYHYKNWLWLIADQDDRAAAILDEADNGAFDAEDYGEAFLDRVSKAFELEV